MAVTAPAAPALAAAAAGVARIRLAVLPTPLTPAPRLGRALGTGPLLIKRDDLTGFAFGGNKARLLEFLLAAALADGADTLVTGGAAGSNFCAVAAAAAQHAGLRCELVIAGLPQPLARAPGPALALALTWGAVVRWTGTSDRDSVDTRAAPGRGRAHGAGAAPVPDATGRGDWPRRDRVRTGRGGTA